MHDYGIGLDIGISSVGWAVVALDGEENPCGIDYIHGDEELVELTRGENAVGFLLPAMEKHQLFRGVISGGVLPRKTFSMGHAREKRYYLEGRKIK